MNEINIAFHERLLIAKTRNTIVKIVERGISIEKRISILKPPVFNTVK